MIRKDIMIAIEYMDNLLDMLNYSNNDPAKFSHKVHHIIHCLNEAKGLVKV